MIGTITRQLVLAIAAAALVPASVAGAGGQTQTVSAAPALEHGVSPFAGRLQIASLARGQSFRDTFRHVD